MSNNPLTKHFRTPSIFIKLPSGGRWWPEGSIDLPISGEIGILPMTTRDEIMIRTPDALLNGEGVVAVIQSCCPNIKNAWKMPSVDLDAVLIGIRIASYGEKMEVPYTCPACKEDNEYEAFLPGVLESIKPPKIDILETQGLKIKLKPMAYFEANTAKQLEFEEQQILRLIADETIEDEEKQKLFTKNLNSLVDANIKAVVDSTEYVEIEDGTRTYDTAHIQEFYENADRSILADIKTHLVEFKESYDIQPMDVSCSSCGHQTKVALEFNYSNFFEVGS